MDYIHDGCISCVENIIIRVLLMLHVALIMDVTLIGMKWHSAFHMHRDTA